MFDFSDTKVIIHIGFPKVASTTLQDCLFSQLNDDTVLYVGKINESQNYSLSEDKTRVFFESIIKSYHMNYDKHKTLNLLNEILKEHTFKTLLISNEDLAFYPAKDSYIIALRLKELFPDSQIIINLRNQLDIIKSYYNMIPHDISLFNLDKTPKIYDINLWIKQQLNNYDSSVLQYFEYNKLINIYEELYGFENIHLILFEDLINDFDYFSNRVSNIIGIDSTIVADKLSNKHKNFLSKRYRIYKNIRRHFPSIEIKNYIPSFIYNSFYKYIKSGNKANPVINNNIIKELDELYKNGNSEILNKFDIDLHKYSYWIKRDE